MTEQEFLARDAALLIELHEERRICIEAQKQIYEANVRMQELNKERIVLRQKYVKEKTEE